MCRDASFFFLVSFSDSEKVLRRGKGGVLYISGRELGGRALAWSREVDSCPGEVAAQPDFAAIDEIGYGSHNFILGFGKIGHCLY